MPDIKSDFVKYGRDGFIDQGVNTGINLMGMHDGVNIQAMFVYFYMHFGFNGRFELAFQDIPIKINNTNILDVNSKIVHAGGSNSDQVFPIDQHGSIASGSDGIAFL